MPGKPHVTEVTPDGKWLEFYACFGRDYFTYMADQGLLSRQPVLFHSLTPALVDSCRALLERFRTVPEGRNFSLFLSMQEFVVTLTQTALQERLKMCIRDRRNALPCRTSAGSAGRDEHDEHQCTAAYD